VNALGLKASCISLFFNETGLERTWTIARDPGLGFLFPACIFRDASLWSHAFARGVGNQGSGGGRSFFDGLRRRFRRSASSGGTRDIGSPAAGGEVEREPSGPDRTRAIQSTGGLRGALVTHHSNARKIYLLDDRCPVQCGRSVA
jgi:hypothetical protein